MPKTKHPKLPKTWGKMKGENPFTKQNIHTAAQFSNFAQWFKVKLWEHQSVRILEDKKLDTLAQEIWDYLKK